MEEVHTVLAGLVKMLQNGQESESRITGVRASRPTASAAQLCRSRALQRSVDDNNVTLHRSHRLTLLHVLCRIVCIMFNGEQSLSSDLLPGIALFGGQLQQRSKAMQSQVPLSWKTSDCAA